MNIVILLIIGLVIGLLFGIITKRSGADFINYMIAGIVGAFLGGYVFPKYGLYSHGSTGIYIIAALGAIVLLFLTYAIQNIKK